MLHRLALCSALFFVAPAYSGVALAADQAAEQDGNRKVDDGKHHQILKGAAAGAVVGHYAGHHAVKGAIAGATAGAVKRHYDKKAAKKKAKEDAAHH